MVGSEFVDLVDVATELSEKHSWVRESFEKFMVLLYKKLAQNSNYDRVFEVEYGRINDQEDTKAYYFRLGDREVSIAVSYACNGFSTRTYIYTVEPSLSYEVKEPLVRDNMHIREIREFLKAFPKIVENLKKQMQKELDKTSKAIEILETLQNALA